MLGHRNSILDRSYFQRISSAYLETNDSIRRYLQVVLWKW